MGYYVFDLETTTHKSHKRTANPFNKLNWVVALGGKHQGEGSETTYYDEPSPVVLPLRPTTGLLIGFNIKFDLSWLWRNAELVHCLKSGGKIWDCQLAEYYLGGQQPAVQMCAMDDIIEKYGGELKIDEVKALWNAGVDTPDIPEDLLLRYLHGDINNTEKIFLGQLVKAQKQGMTKIIMARMEGLLCTVEMEYNGIRINYKQAMTDRDLLISELKELDDVLIKAIPDNLPNEFAFNWGSGNHKSALLFGGACKYKKWMPTLDDETFEQLYVARVDKHCIKLSDGKPTQFTFEEFESLPLNIREAAMPKLVTFKAGKNQGALKTKNVSKDDLTKPRGSIKELIYEFTGFTKARPEWAGKKVDALGNPVYSVGKDTMDILKGSTIPFIQALCNHSAITKDLSTYYLVEETTHNKKTGESTTISTGMLTCCMLDEDDSEFGYIHHKLNMNKTVTSRMSSSDPNLQNISRADFSKALGRPKSLVKRMFISRFHEDGAMCEIDYSQLEVIVQGVLSKDKTLMDDIIAGVDFHCKRLAYKLGEDYDEVKLKAKTEDHPEYDVYSVLRTKIKQFTFQRAYGAGKAAIAAETGMTEDEVQELMDVEERLYPGITKFYDAVQEAVEGSRWQTRLFEPFPDGGGQAQLGKGEWYAPSGTRYVFTEKPAAKFIRKRTGMDATIYRPHIQNYPVQGTGGEMVQVVLGKLMRHFMANDNYGGKAFLCNTVHDCVWFDCHKDVLQQVTEECAKIMCDIPKYYNEMFPDMNIIVPFRVDVEVGDDMMEMCHLPKYMKMKGWPYVEAE